MYLVAYPTHGLESNENSKSATGSDQIIHEVKQLLHTYTGSQGAIPLGIMLQEVKDAEIWTHLIIKALIYNLTPGSDSGRFGTPDNDILNAIKANPPQEKRYIKILKQKLDELRASDMGMLKGKKERIERIYTALSLHFTPHFTQ